MKTEWNGVALNRTKKGLMEKHCCSACPSKCYLVLPVTEEPPEICSKEEVMTSAQAQHNSLREV